MTEDAITFRLCVRPAFKTQQKSCEIPTKMSETSQQNSRSMNSDGYSQAVRIPTKLSDTHYFLPELENAKVVWNRQESMNVIGVVLLARTENPVSKILGRTGSRRLKFNWNTDSIREPPLRSSHLSSELKSEQTEVSRLKAVSPSRNSSSDSEDSVHSERPECSLNGSSAAWL